MKSQWKCAMVMGIALGCALGCGSGSSSTGDGGGGGDTGSGQSSYQIMFTSTGAITGTWAWSPPMGLLCLGNSLEASVKNTGPDAGDSGGNITIAGDGSFTFRTGSVPGGVKGKATGGATVSSDLKKVDWKVTFASTVASDMGGNSVTLNGSITALCIL